jgi:hypothetical protein
MVAYHYGWLHLAFVAIDFAFTLASGNAGICVGFHLAAGAMDFFYRGKCAEGKIGAPWMIHLVNWLDDLFSPVKETENKSQNQKHFYRASAPLEKK